MISEAEVRRLAARAGVDAMVQDLDYALGWYLAGLLRQPTASECLIFKGGTCLRKCYFPDYRFSEDLDFTWRGPWNIEGVQRDAEEAKKWSLASGGPDFNAAPSRWEIVDDDYGRESMRARIYYRGPLRWSGPARVIQLDTSRGESVVFPVHVIRLIHPFSDSGVLGEVDVPCYSLPEMLAEKTRAIGGQRRFAVSRDLYDIYQLCRNGVKASTVQMALPAKFAAKNLSLSEFTIDRLVARRDAMAADWAKRLVYLFPAGQLVAFEDAWAQVLKYVQEVLAPDAGAIDGT